MAFETGTAATRQEFRTKLIEFLTENADLVAADQAWTVAWEPPNGSEDMDDIVLKGPGLAGQDNVYVALRMAEDIPQDAYWMDFRGCAGVIGSAVRYNEHVNPQPFPSRLFLDTAPMTYWFIANGRRFIIVLKISTIFQCVYAGLFLPYGTPISYPYPLFVGAAASEWRGHSDSARNWRSTAAGFANWWNGYWSNGGFDQPPAAYLMSPAGEWLSVAGEGSIANLSFGPQDTSRDGYFIGRGENQNQYPDEQFVNARARAAYGGQFTMMPLQLFMANPTKQTYGIMDGVNKCQGQDNASENIITLDSVDYLVVQNTFRTAIDQYVAVALE